MANPRDHFGQPVQINRRRAAIALQQFGGAQAFKGAANFSGTGGQQTKVGVLQHLHPDTAEADGQHRAPGRITRNADEQFGAALPHRRNEYALDLRGGGLGRHRSHDPVITGRDVRIALQRQQHAADFGLVRNIGREDLEHHRPAHRAGMGYGLCGIARDMLRNHR